MKISELFLSESCVWNLDTLKVEIVRDGFKSDLNYIPALAINLKNNDCIAHLHKNDVLLNFDFSGYVKGLNVRTCKLEAFDENNQIISFSLDDDTLYVVKDLSVMFMNEIDIFKKYLNRVRIIASTLNADKMTSYIHNYIFMCIQFKLIGDFDESANSNILASLNVPNCTETENRFRSHYNMEILKALDSNKFISVKLGNYKIIETTSVEISTHHYNFIIFNTVSVYEEDSWQYIHPKYDKHSFGGTYYTSNSECLFKNAILWKHSKLTGRKSKFSYLSLDTWSTTSDVSVAESMINNYHMIHRSINLKFDTDPTEMVYLDGMIITRCGTLALMNKEDLVFYCYNRMIKISYNELALLLKNDSIKIYIKAGRDVHNGITRSEIFVTANVENLNEDVIDFAFSRYISGLNTLPDLYQ